MTPSRGHPLYRHTNTHPCRRYFAPSDLLRSPQASSPDTEWDSKSPCLDRTVAGTMTPFGQHVAQLIHSGVSIVRTTLTLIIENEIKINFEIGSFDSFGFNLDSFEYFMTAVARTRPLAMTYLDKQRHRHFHCEMNFWCDMILTPICTRTCSAWARTAKFG